MFFTTNMVFVRHVSIEHVFRVFRSGFNWICVGDLGTLGLRASWESLSSAQLQLVSAVSRTNPVPSCKLVSDNAWKGYRSGFPLGVKDIPAVHSHWVTKRGFDWYSICIKEVRCSKEPNVSSGFWPNTVIHCSFLLEVIKMVLSHREVYLL